MKNEGKSVKKIVALITFLADVNNWNLLQHVIIILSGILGDKTMDDKWCKSLIIIEKIIPSVD